MSNQAKTINLNYLTDPTFSTANRLFVLLFQSEEQGASFQSIIHQKLK